jgi:hypothetical protein
MVPGFIKILGFSCFASCGSICSVSFESPSSLKRIASLAFYGLPIKSILIPCEVEVEVLCSSCFFGCNLFTSISFESSSSLTTIEYYVFSSSSLESIVIPRNVNFIDGSAFSSTPLKSMFLEPGNNIFRIENCLLFNIVRGTLIHGFNLESRIFIPNFIKSVGISCFLDCTSLSRISFASPSSLKQIESGALLRSSIKSILIPCEVEVLCSSCFAECKSLASISFESPSLLIRIGHCAFYDSSLESIVIPRNAKIIEIAAFSMTQIQSMSIESG